MLALPQGETTGWFFPLTSCILPLIPFCCTISSESSEALWIVREIGGWRGEGIWSWNLGLSYADSDPVRAAELVQVFVDYGHEIGHPDAEADAARVEEIRAVRTADGQD